MSSIALDLSTAGVGELVDAHAAIAAELAARTAPESGASCMETAQRLGEAIDVSEVALAVLVRRVDESREVRAYGFSCTAAWLAAGMGMRMGRARERLVLARRLDRLPRVAKLAAAGRLSYGYAATIADAVTRLDDADTEAAEAIMLGWISGGCTPQTVARRAEHIHDIVATRDGTETPDGDTRRGYRRSWLSIAGSLDGGAFLKGWVDPELKALLKAALGPLSRPTGADDERDHRQRQADALKTLLSGGGRHWNATLVIDWATLTGTSGHRSGAGDGSGSASTGRVASRRHDPGVIPDREPHDGTPHATGLPPDGSVSGMPPGGLRHDPAAPGGLRRDDAAPGGVPPDGPPPGDIAPRGICLDDTPPGDACPEDDAMPCDEFSGEVLGGVPSAAVPRDVVPADGHHDGSGIRYPSGTAGPTGARLLDGTPIPPERARQIALGAGISALILGPRSQPLYLGRRVRLATSAQRRALEARYETCATDGCDLPATLCEIDHVRPYGAGGRTDIDGLAPNCGFHNRYRADHPEKVTVGTWPDGRWRFTIALPRWGRRRSPPGRDPRVAA